MRSCGSDTIRWRGGGQGRCLIIEREDVAAGQWSSGEQTIRNKETGRLGSRTAERSKTVGQRGRTAKLRPDVFETGRCFFLVGSITISITLGSREWQSDPDLAYKAGKRTKSAASEGCRNSKVKTELYRTEI